MEFPPSFLVSIHPLDVCFDGVYVIEKDKGYAGAAGSLAQTHSADSIWRVGIDNRFDQHDNIGIKSGKNGDWLTPLMLLTPPIAIADPSASTPGAPPLTWSKWGNYW